MYKKYKILAIIPARAGSERIKNKNLKPINNKPLIYYSIKYALQNSTLIDKISVSTNDKKIFKYSKKFNSKIYSILRPNKISKNNSSDLGYLEHTIQYFKKKNMEFDIIAIIRPTTPIRKKNLLLNCLKKLLDSGASSVRSAKCVEHNHPYWMYKVKGHKLKEVIKGKNFFKYYQSQKLPKFYMHDGHCDIIFCKNILRKDFKYDLKKIYGKNMIYYNNDQKYSINIDEPLDFEIANHILTKTKKI